MAIVVCNKKKKKDILIVGRSLGVGGIEKALADFVDSIDRTLYDVSLLLFTQKGNIQLIDNSKTTIVESAKILNYLAVTNLYAKQHIVCYIIRSIIALLCKLFGSYRVYSFIFSFMKSKGPYDIAISFFHDQTLNGLYYGTNLFLLTKVNADKKIAWIHSDYVGTRLNIEERNNLYKKFDAVVNVSHAMRKKFDSLKLIPVSKSFVVYNRINNKKIKDLSLQPYSNIDCRFNIISVCRLDHLKSPMELCRVANRLRKRGLEFQWHIIGDGPLMNKLSDYIKNESLDNHVYLEGIKKNPYPYVKNADLFVSGSISETFGLSIYESLLLETPVVAFRYEAIEELVDTSNGIVVNTFEEMGDIIEMLITDSALYCKLLESTRLKIDYNEASRKQFDDMINSINTYENSNHTFRS